MATIPEIEQLLLQWKTVAERSNQPFVWAHIVQASFIVSLADGRGEREPITRAIICEIDGILRKVGQTAGEPGFDRAALAELSAGLAAYHNAQPPTRALGIADQFLRWVASGTSSPPDWTLWQIGLILKRFGLHAAHFDAEAWPAALPAPTEKEESSREQLLGELVGLEGVKTEVKGLESFLELLRERKKRKLPTGPMPLHQVFLGNPGTGKTTIARVLARIYKEFGLLERGHLVETDRSGLVGSVIGETELKTTAKINAALGGVLFIDEAYSLATNSQQDFGQRAIDTLVKAMEDHRDRLVVIVAGYSEEMQVFLEANPGLYGRFNRHLLFADYSDGELLEVFQRLARKEKFNLSEETLPRVSAALSGRRDRLKRRFANARDARTLWELTLQRQATRLCETQGMDLSALADDDLLRISPEDIPDSF